MIPFPCRRMATQRSSRVTSIGWMWVFLSCLVVDMHYPVIFVQAAIPCSYDNDQQEGAAFCARILGKKGSECVDGYCTNPFAKGGCLRNYLSETEFGDNNNGLNQSKKIWMRICNSDDPPDAEAKGLCRHSAFDYTEVRIAGQNWDSNFISAWILQIILSELLEVPASIETSKPGMNVDFYNLHSSMDYGGGDFYYGELVTAEQVKDCREVKSTKSESPEDYQSCFHVVPEVWWEDRFGSIMVRLDGAEPPRELGALGYQSFFIPRFAIENDPTLVSYVGLKGEENRRKLAETFKRPATWKQYCAEVAPKNCSQPDGVAARPPNTTDEGAQYFQEGVYTGYFRHTEKNDCDKNPSTCTGFLMDFPCGWSSFARQQLFHWSIALESDNPDDPVGGFPSGQTKQIWAAANATKSPVIAYEFDLSINYFRYMRTDAELTRVVFPEPTQDCLDARIDPGDRCGGLDNADAIFGKPEGACAATTQSLKKIISKALRDISFDPHTPEALWSPAFDVISNFQIMSPQLGQVVQYWQEFNGRDPSGFDLRDATCRWVVENMDLVASFIPESHPRSIQDEDVSGHALFGTATAFASLAIGLVLLSMMGAFLKKDTKVMYYTQPEFMFLFLFGLLLVGMGAIIFVIPPTDLSCVSIAWLINLGYIIHLVPLFVRINAINNLATSGKQMQRVRLKLHNLYASVATGVVAVVAYLLAWTLIDPPKEAFKYEMTNQVTEAGETIVTAFDFCGSDSDVWHIVTYAWIALLLVPAGIIAFMSVRVREDMNDTKSMSLVFLVHCVFLVLGITVFFLTQDKHRERSDYMGYQSLLLSADMILSLAVYVFPKFYASGENLEAEPLPDVFVDTTIAIIEVYGFAAWSSVREPFQVFKFLEELYGTVDMIAERHHVYKVETSAERYVAATGIPNARHDHAVCMARFASDCMKKMPRFTRKMEVTFGPDTADMSLRIGMHSGAVVAGFLKGKGARFQLFGETMTTASIIQSTGMSGQIHLSDATAAALNKCGKRKWVVEREDKVWAVEKGEMKTFWLVRGRNDGCDYSSQVGSNNSIHSENDELMEFSLLDSQQRWVQYNVATMSGLLKEIVARRQHSLRASSNESFSAETNDKAEIPLDEVVEIIELPDFDKKAARRQRENIARVELSDTVVKQLREYVSCIAELYNNNPFHSFAHCSYVVMAITKYMNRIKGAYEVDVGNDEERYRSSTLAAIHKHTYGVTSDPLTLFSCVYSALIHDVNHPGVTNLQLIKEDEALGAKYKNRSVAEQRSFDMSWQLLMDDRFKDLRCTICSTEEELRRFRQLVINSIMATDLGDKEMKEMRNKRWEKAFQNQVEDSCSADASATDSSTSASFYTKDKSRDLINRKATIVIEHLIQAADVAHMSQHWMIYRKWNERLFRECYKAYRDGRVDTNPAVNWYKGEIGFFDFYVIPLSRKLKDCGVFGPTSSENLNYATNNRSMWEKEGQKITEEMLQAVEKEYENLKGAVGAYTV